MKAPLATLLLLAFALPTVADEEVRPVRMFSDANAAVQSAQTGNRLIFFTLLDSSTDDSIQFTKLLNDNKLKLSPEEFVVATCDAGQSSNVSLFESRFEQDIEQKPVVVITNPKGEVLSSISGIQAQESYDIIVHDALVKAGMREDDSPVISSATGEVIEGSSDIFRILKSEMAVRKIELTEYRTWTLSNGETFEGALLEAKGANGIFISEAGEETSVAFNSLSPEDISVIQQALSE